MRKLSSFLSFGFIILLSGCSSKVSNSDIVGAYKDNNLRGISTLVLKSDGTLSQILITRDKKQYTSTGTWTFDSKENRIDFENILYFGNLKVERGGANYSVEKNLSRRSIADSL